MPTPRVAETAAYERRIVTVLFADLVGFTALSELLDAEDVAAIQDRYFAAVRETVDRHGGVLEKFIGDAAMAAFGAPRTRDDDPEQAVLAGLAIVAAVERLDATPGLDDQTLAVRIGIATGEVAYASAGSDAGRLTGDTVNTAARLQTAAPVGSVLVSETTALAVADVIELEPLTPLVLKGKAEPVRAAVVVRPRPSRSREAAMADLRAPTLGRETEIALLTGAATRIVRDGGIETWLIIAPPGTGKTRLLDEVAARLPGAGNGKAAAILRARFRARDARPFGALTDVAESALTSVAAGGNQLAAALEMAGVVRGRVGTVAAAVLDLARGAATASASNAAAESRDARFAAWLEGLDALARPGAAIWLIEDVHWAGPDAVAFLELARATAVAAGRLLIVTARPAFLEQHGDWGANDATSGGRALELATLPAATTVALVEALVGRDVLPAALVGRIARASDGNCLFVEEILRLWVSAGLLVRDGNAWELRAAAETAVAVPTSVQAVYAAQLDELPADGRQIVRRGSVSGRRVANGWLDRVGVADPRAALESLRARRLFDGPAADPLFGSAYVYRHALLRDAAYSSLARADRAALHVRFAHWLEQATDDAGSVAELLGDHLESALDAAPALAREVGEGLDREAASRDASRWLELAAERAARAGARDHAVQLFARSVARTPTSERLDLARRQRRHGEATADAARLDAAVGLLETAVGLYREVLADPTDGTAARAGLAAAANSLARVLGEQLLFERSAEAADAILGELGDSGDGPSAWLRLRAAIARHMFSDDPADLVPAATAVIEIADREADRQLALEARLALLTAVETPPAETIANARTVGDLARELGRADVEARALRIQAVGIVDGDGDPTEILERAAALSISRGLDESLGWIEYLRAELAFRFGDWDTAVAAGIRAVEIGERHAYHRVVVRTWHAVVPVLAARGDLVLLRRAAAWYEAYASFFPDSPFGRLMHAGVNLEFAAHGIAARPDLSPTRLLASFTVDEMASWFEAADGVLSHWIAEGALEPARQAVESMEASELYGVRPLTTGIVGVMRARQLAAGGNAPAATDAVRAALPHLRQTRTPWWIAKALRLLERIGEATAAERGEAAAIERALGARERAP